MSVALVDYEQPWPCFEETPVTLGPMTGATWRRDPKHLGMTLARYKFVSKMLTGLNTAAEIGCADAFGSQVVKREVGLLDLYDCDEKWRPYARQVGAFFRHDIVWGALRAQYDAIYALDVIEHIRPEDEPAALRNICESLQPNGVFIAGTPSRESQRYASDESKAGHVNCHSGEDMRTVMRRHFANVFLFSMNDEVVHTGFSPMAHYFFVICTGKS